MFPGALDCRCRGYRDMIVVTKEACRAHSRCSVNSYSTTHHPEPSFYGGTYWLIRSPFCKQYIGGLSPVRDMPSLYPQEGWDTTPEGMNIRLVTSEQAQVWSTHASCADYFYMFQQGRACYSHLTNKEIKAQESNWEVKKLGSKAAQKPLCTGRPQAWSTCWSLRPLLAGSPQPSDL